MCLNVDINQTEKAKKNKTGKVIRWKVVDEYCHSLISFFQFCYKWKIGWNRSNRKNAEINSNDEPSFFKINKGIHVFTSRKKARRLSIAGARIVKVICYKKDLVAVGLDNDEVYMKVFLPKDEHDDALRRKGKERR